MATAALLAGLTGAASAATGGAASPGGTPARPSPAGSPEAGAPSAGELSLLSATTAPRKAFYYGFRYPQLRFEIDSTQAENDLRIDVVDSEGKPVKRFFRNDVRPRIEVSVRWDGTTTRGRPAPSGRYRFRIVPQSGDAAARQSLARSIRRARRRASSSGSHPVRLGFAIFRFAFPLLGPHDFGGAGSRFGAGRSGHSHQGHDVMARCGQTVVAARGGRVQFSGYQGAAGNYVVIDGRGTGYDTAYMHLLRPSPLRKGMRVRTGQPIGRVGSTGSSTTCHLHFELWAPPGWYEGGRPVDPLPHLRRWDRYS